MFSLPRRGEVWWVDLPAIPTDRRHEIAKRRPCLVLSADEFNRGVMVVVVPLTSTLRQLPYGVRVDPPEGGVDRPSLLKCDQVRSIDRRRLDRRLGKVQPDTLAAVQETVEMILDF